MATLTFLFGKLYKTESDNYCNFIFFLNLAQCAVYLNRVVCVLDLYTII